MTANSGLDMAARLVAQCEGCRLEPYQCPAGKWTVGYGNTALADGSPVTPETPPLTAQEAEALLVLTLSKIAAKVHDMVTVPLTDGQEAALLSFAYNVGTGALRGSTLLRLLNAGDTAGASAQFGAWVYANGRQLPGLVTRRALERAVFDGKVRP